MNPDDCMEAIHNILVHKFQAIRIVRVRVACCINAAECVQK
mgnify:CR=1 FL=1